MIRYNAARDLQTKSLFREGVKIDVVASDKLSSALYQRLVAQRFFTGLIKNNLVPYLCLPDQLDTHRGEFLLLLQCIHDENDPEDWKKELERLAVRFDLDIEAIKNL